MHLGLDIGTSGLKGIVLDEKGAISTSYTEPLTIYRPHIRWSEQNPSDWIKAAQRVFIELKQHLPYVDSIGISGQMHGAVCLDSSGNVIRPCILWNDTRSHKEAAYLDANCSLKSIFGNITFPGFTSPKILWMKENEPENYARINKVLLPKDYLRYWLSGDFVSDMSDASGTAWLDIAARDWSDKLLEASGLSRKYMPRLVEGSEPSGTIRNKIANEFGLPQGTIIAGGAGDNAATAIGINIMGTGTAFVSLGTSGVVFAANNYFKPNPNSAIHAFSHAVPNVWHQMGVTLSATDCLNWLSTQFEEQPSLLLSKLGNEVTSPTSELFLPFLGGERTPYNSSNLRASFHNIGHETNRVALTQAVLEGVCFSLKQCIDLIEEKGEEIEYILAVGGGARSDYWLSLLATILGRDILRPEGAEHAAAIGAARLGALAIGNDIKLTYKFDFFEKANFSDDYTEKYNRYLKACKIALQ